MKDFKSVGKMVDGNEGDKCKYPFRLDTYGCGCQHDCKYCYAKSLLDFRNLWDAKNPSVASIADISREIKKIKRGQVIRLGGMTDCFQPLEVLHRNTYKTIQILNRRRIPYLIVTKSALVADYADILDRDLAHIQVTVTTLDDDLAATYEKASKPSDRVKSILRLQNGGFDVQLRLSPFIPQNVDFDRLNALGTYGEFMEQYYNIFQQCYDMLDDDTFLVIKVGEIRDKKTGIYRNFVGDTITAMLKCGFKYYNEIILVTAVGTLPLRVNKSMQTRKVGKVHQNVLVFYKGDPKKISTKFPVLQYDEQALADED